VRVCVCVCVCARACVCVCVCVCVRDQGHLLDLGPERHTPDFKGLLVSLSLRLKDLLGPVTRVKKKEEEPSCPAPRAVGPPLSPLGIAHRRGYLRQSLRRGRQKSISPQGSGFQQSKPRISAGLNEFTPSKVLTWTDLLGPGYSRKRVEGVSVSEILVTCRRRRVRSL